MTFKHSVLIITVVLAALACVGCGGDDDPMNPGGTTLPAALVATWEFDSATVDGTPTALAVVLEWDPATVKSEIMFGSSGTFSLEEQDAAGASTYSSSGKMVVSGTGFTLTTTMENGSPVPADVFSGTWSLAGDVLTLTAPDPQGLLVITMKKSSTPGGGGGTVPPELVATWVFQSAMVNGVSTPLNVVMEWAPTTVTAMIMIAADATFVLTERDAGGATTGTASGTVAASSDGTLVLTTTMEDGVPLVPIQVDNGTWAVAGNQLTVTIVELLDTIVLVATK